MLRDHDLWSWSIINQAKVELDEKKKDNIPAVVKAVTGFVSFFSLACLQFVLPFLRDFSGKFYTKGRGSLIKRSRSHHRDLEKFGVGFDHPRKPKMEDSEDENMEYLKDYSEEGKQFPLVPSLSLRKCWCDACTTALAVGPSPIKKFEPTRGRFVDVMANGTSSYTTTEFRHSRFIAMVFEMNPELGALSDNDKDNKVFDQVTHVLDRMKQLFPYQTMNGTQEESGGYKGQTESRGTKRRGAAKLSTKTPIQGRVAKRGNAKHARSQPKDPKVLELEFMVDKLAKNIAQMLNVTSKPPPNPADHVHPGIILRKIDETYEFDDDNDDEVLP